MLVTQPIHMLVLSGDLIDIIEWTDDQAAARTQRTMSTVFSLPPSDSGVISPLQPGYVMRTA
jgi:hypothetical protein